MTLRPADLARRSGPIVAIVNPGASRVRGPTERARLIGELDAWAQALGGRSPTLRIAADGPAIEAAGREAIAVGASVVVAVGGDGTIATITAHLAGSGIPIAVIPAGTGNVLATALGIPDSPRNALRALVDARLRAIDVGDAILDRAPARPIARVFSVAAGVGWDARVVDATRAGHKRHLGRLAYWVAALGLLRHLAPVSYDIEVDGERLEIEATVALVANCGDLVPGLVRPRLRIVPDDGLLDLLVLRVGSVAGGMRGALELLARTELGGSPSGEAFRLRGRRIHVAADPDQPRQVDGDGFGAGPMLASVRPAALDVLVPRARW